MVSHEPSFECLIIAQTRSLDAFRATDHVGSWYDAGSE